MQRYVDEFTFRFNRRTGEMQDIFSQTILNMAANPQLPYKTLTAKTA
jgi:hypothetical protein